MPRYTTEKELTKFTYGVTTYVTFKYEATRSSDGKKVVFKIEPRIKYKDSTTSNAAAVFFNSNYPTTSSTTTVTTFTHSCACNSTYSAKDANGNWKHNWYGATGTSTQSVDNDYPADSDAWAYGNWSSISVPVEPTSTSVTLYFNFYNEWGYGNYKSNGQAIWDKGAKNYRFGVSFTVPVGYTQNGKPGTPTAVSDAGKIAGLATDVANEYITVQWDAPTLGTNNSVASYKIHVGVWGKIDGSTEGRKSYLYASGITTRSQKIYRSTIESKVGIDANTKVTEITGQSKYWNCIDVRIEAIDEYGNSTYSEIPGWQFYWNERPTAPTNIRITNEDADWPNNTVGMDNYWWAGVVAEGAIDRWIPEFPSNFTEASSTEPPYYHYVITRSSSTPDNQTFSSLGYLTSSYAYLYDDLLGIKPELGLGPYYVHARAYDGQLNSNSIYTTLHLGKALVADDTIKILDKDGNNSLTLSPDLQLIVPAVHLDSADSYTQVTHYPATSADMTIRIMAYKVVNGSPAEEAKEVCVKTIKALQENGAYSIPFSDFWNTLMAQLDIDLSGNATNNVNIHFFARITCSKETRLSVDVSNSIDYTIRHISVTGELISANTQNGPLKPLLYAYGQVAPYVERDIVAQFSIQNLPAGVYVNYYIDYAPLGTSDSPTDSTVAWATLSSGRVSNAEIHQICMPMPTAFYSKALKFRLCISDSLNHTSYQTLYWPMPRPLLPNTQKIQYASVNMFGRPLPVVDSAIMNDDYTRQIVVRGVEDNKVEITYGIDWNTTPHIPLYMRPGPVYDSNYRLLWSPYNPDPEKQVDWTLCVIGEGTGDYKQEPIEFCLTFTDAVNIGNQTYFAPKILTFKMGENTQAEVDYYSNGISQSGAYLVNKDNQPLVLTLEMRAPLSTQCGWTNIEDANLKLDDAQYMSSAQILFRLNSRYMVDSDDLNLTMANINRAGGSKV